MDFFSPVNLVASLIYTWGFGLAPALVARLIWKGPVGPKTSTAIALITCVILAIGGLILKDMAGVHNPRISPAWFLVFFASRAIMRKGAAAQKQRSREEMFSKLQGIIDDPETDENRRTHAINSLAALKSKRT